MFLSVGVKLRFPFAGLVPATPFRTSQGKFSQIQKNNFLLAVVARLSVYSKGLIRIFPSKAEELPFKAAYLK